MLSYALRSGRDLLRDCDQRQRITAIALIGCILAIQLSVAIVAAIVLAKVIPVEQRIRKVVTTERVVHVRRVVIPVPTDRTYPALDDPKKACSGAPVIIQKLTVAGWQGQDKGDRAVNTWLTVRPAGDAYTVACYVLGDYSEGWKEGDLVSLIAGKVAGS